MHKSLVIILVAVGLTYSLSGTAQQSRADQLMVDADSYRAQLEELELGADRYDPSLLESLESLAGVMVGLDQFNEADEILDRVIQILRINEGLYTDRQFPFLVLSIRNDVRRGNWRGANETMDHLVRLYTLVPRQWDEELISELVQISDLHLEGVAGDLEIRKDYHFRAADRISWTAVRIGERVWPGNDLRLVDLYYHLLKQNHLKYVTLIQGGEVAADLRQIAPNTGWMRSRRGVVESYYRLGLEMLRRMRTVYELRDPIDLEATGMVDLYRADWQVLFDEGTPENSYEMAYEGLLAAGVDAQVLDNFFSIPQILPVNNFYPSVEQAHSAVTAISGQLTTGQTSPPSLLFVEWASTTPNIQTPIERPLLLQSEINGMITAELSVRLDGTDKVSRWIRSRYISQVSVVEQFDWLNNSARQALSADELAERLHYLNFRPVLEQGIPQAFEGILEYRYFPQRGE